MSHSGLDPQKVDLFLNAYIPFVIVCVLPPDKPNYGTNRACLGKGVCISMRDYEATTTTGVERKFRQAYVKSFEK